MLRSTGSQELKVAVTARPDSRLALSASGTGGKKDKSEQAGAEKGKKKGDAYSSDKPY